MSLLGDIRGRAAWVVFGCMLCQLGLAYVYLGYWIGGCGKMSYKTRFRPIEALGPNGWSVMGETPDGHTPPG